ncbi:uncharacterized protein LOC142356889 isoform X4 [Convolutriloba macropyga]|uniref:uncharacterized protein LOC142356889 isoform X4 n=1 Tax=Convolutriloba macropyga TaxID=536237 RepID=UPI003F51E5D4
MHVNKFGFGGNTSTIRRQILNSRRVTNDWCTLPRIPESTLEKEGKQTENGTVIYTDWANHYLSKAGNGHTIVDLQRDVRSGVLLAEVIQSVSGETIHGVTTNPAHDGEALENIAACLAYLASKGVNVHEIQPQDILDGNLKCILTLFYGLSRLKQRSRSSAQGSTSQSSAVSASANITGTAAANCVTASSSSALVSKRAAAASTASSTHFSSPSPIPNSAHLTHHNPEYGTAPGPPQTPQHLPAHSGNPRQEIPDPSRLTPSQFGSPVNVPSHHRQTSGRGSPFFHSQHPIQKQQLPPTPVAQRSNSFTSGDNNRPLTVASQHQIISQAVIQQQLANQSTARQLSEISESDYDYGSVAYSCSSEVYQSLTGAQLWSPSKTTAVSSSASRLTNSSNLGSSSSSCATPTRQVGRGSTPVSDVPSYYLRSLSPPPVVDHYSSSAATAASVSEVGKRERSTSKGGGISRLFAGSKDIKKKKNSASGIGSHSGTVSDGESVYSPARSAIIHPKSPLKTALGKAFGAKSQQPTDSTTSSTTITSSNQNSNSSQPSTHAQESAHRNLQSPSEQPPQYQRSLSAAPASTNQVLTPVPLSAGANMPAQYSSGSQSQLTRRLPEQTHIPPPPQTTSIPQPKSRASPNRSTPSNTSGIPTSGPSAGIKSPPEVRKGIPQPSSRPKSPATVTPTTGLSKAPSRVPAASTGGKIPTSLSRSKSPAASTVLSSVTSGDKESARKLKQPSDNSSSSSQASTETPANAPRQPKTEPEAGQGSSLPQPASKTTSSQPSYKSNLPQSGIRPPGSVGSGKPVSRNPSQIGRLKSGIATGDHKPRAASVSAQKKTVSARTSPTLTTDSGSQNEQSPLNRCKSPPAALTHENKDKKSPSVEKKPEPAPLNESNESDTLVTAEVANPVVSNQQKVINVNTDEVGTSEHVGSTRIGAVTAQVRGQQSKPVKIYGAVKIGTRETTNVTANNELYGYATDSDVLSPTTTCDSDSNYGPVYGSVGHAGYLSEGADMMQMGSAPATAAAMMGCKMPGPGGTRHHLQPMIPSLGSCNQEQRVFKDGISAIKDCLQRSDIKLAESDSEGDVDSVTSNISDLVNDLSSDISANITSPLDKSKTNINSTTTSAHASPANHAASKPLQDLNYDGSNDRTHLNGQDPNSVVHVPPMTHPMRASKKTAIVQPQQHANRSEETQQINTPQNTNELTEINCEKVNEEFSMYSSSESSPQLSNNKNHDSRSNATIKRCPNSKLQPLVPSQDSKGIQSHDSSAFTNPDPSKMTSDILAHSQSQQPLTGQVRGNVFRLSSVSSVVSEEHEDARSDDCQRHSGGSFQNSELVNSNESLTVLHSRNQAINSNVSAINLNQVANLSHHQANLLQQSNTTPIMNPKASGSLISNKKAVPAIHAESDVEWETASMASQRSSTLMMTSNDKSCFSDTEDITGRRDHGQANLRRMLETRAAQMNNQQSRKPSAGSEYLESSFALMDIRNLRERLANPHNIDTQSDYGGSGLSSTLSRSKSGKLGSRIDSQIEGDSPIEKMTLLGTISPGTQSIDNARGAQNKHYTQLPLTQELLNKAAGLNSCVSPSSISTCSGANNNIHSHNLSVETNSNRLSAMSDYNPRSYTANSSAMNTPVLGEKLGMKHSRSGSSTGLFQAATATGSSKGSSSHHGSTLPPELTLNSTCNPLDFFCGSNMSLNSASSFESANVENQNMAETIRRLKNELLMSNEKVNRLTTHIICNAQTVASFEKTLSNLNQKLSNIFPDGSESTANEIENLKNLIEELKVNQKPELLSSSQKELRDPTAVSKGRESHVRANSLDAGCLLSSDSKIDDVIDEVPGGADETDKAPSDETVHRDNSSPIGGQSMGAGDKMSDKKVKKNWLRSTFKIGRKKSPIGGPVAGGSLSCASDAEDSSSQNGGSNPASPFHPCPPPPAVHGIDPALRQLATASQIVTSPMHHFNSALASASPGDSASLPRYLSRPKSSGDVLLSHNLTIHGRLTGGGGALGATGLGGTGGGGGGGSISEGQHQLKQKLAENEKKLTETKLQFLSSAHQIDQMKDEMSLLKNELDMLRNENEKLAHHTPGSVSSSRCSPSASSVTSSNCAACRHSSSESCSASDLQHSNSDLCLSVLLDTTLSSANFQVLASQGQLDTSQLKVVRVKLALGNPCDSLEPQASSYYIGTVGITPNTQWAQIDTGVQKVFCDYMAKVDQNQLGLNADSLRCWSSGKTITRTFTPKDSTNSDTPTPTPTNDRNVSESPFDFFKSDCLSDSSASSVNTITPIASAQNSSDPMSSLSSAASILLHPKGRGEDSCDSLVFDTCVPKSHLQRYFNQWTEFRKLVFIGPPGTGKSFIARKLMSHLLSEKLSSDSSEQQDKRKKNTNGGGDSNGPSTTGSLNMDLDDISDLRKTVKDILNSCGNYSKTVLFVENLHSLGSQMSEALSILSNFKPSMPVYTIATMTSQPNQSYPQLQKVFPRWVVFNNHNEPISGLVGRFLRRKLLEFENRNGGVRNSQLQHVVDWLPKVWQHVNRLIELYNSAEVTLGPQLFLSCPMDQNQTQSWFHNLWNFSLAPYLIEAIREGLQLYGNKPGTPWEDPLVWVEDTYPWNCTAMTAAKAQSGSHQAGSKAPSPGKLCPPLTRIRKEDVGFDKVNFRTVNPTLDLS